MDSFLSSPDPLNDSATYRSPVKLRRESGSKGSSPTKQTFELDVGNHLSPQKIRVTVEAGNSDAENAYTHFADTKNASPTPIRRPLNLRRERTTTTTVPVKGLSDSDDDTLAIPKRGRGRPRKSAGTPVPVKNKGRASTPTQKSKVRKSIGSLVDGDDKDDLNFLLGNGVEVGRGRARSRSRSNKRASRISTPAPIYEQSSDKVVSSITSKKGRGRRKTLMPDEVVVLEDGTSRGVDEDEGPKDVDMLGALSTIDGSRSPPAPTSSTTRSTVAGGHSKLDITLARSDPRDETPRKIVWSSPQMVDAPRSSPKHQPRSYPSPSISPEKTPRTYYGEGSVAIMPTSPEHREPGINQQDQKPKQDGENQYQEFDTILESEGFSMISVDSVPLLREHMSSPTNLNPEQESPKPLQNKDIFAVQGAEVTGRDDSFSSIPEEILVAATPGRKVHNPHQLSVQNVCADDFFSSIPPDVLEAGTPTRKSRFLKLLNTTDATGVLEPGIPGRELLSAIPSLAFSMGGDAYEESFSAIPSAILDAATPAPAQKAFLRPNSVNRTDVVSDTLTAPGSSQRLSSTRDERDITSQRLPTPEDTPSPGEIVNQQPSAPSNKDSAANSATGSADNFSRNESSFVSHMRSSPPSIAPRRYTHSAHLRQQRDVFPDNTQTPSIVFSSPSLPPPIQFLKGHPVFTSNPNEAQRPKLSPIARAGRALQGIAVPSSQRGRAQSLGSPFKSPVAERNLSSFRDADLYPFPTQARRVDHLPRFDIAESLVLKNFQRNATQRSVHIEDPFRNDVKTHPRSPLREENQGYALELPAQHRISDHRLTSARSENESVRSDDAMSWQAEEEVMMNDATMSFGNTIDLSSKLRASSTGDETTYLRVENSEASEQRWAAERDAVKKQMEAANTSQVIVIDSDDDASDAQDPNDEEGLDLLLETLHSSSPMPQSQQQLQRTNDQKPRRSQIPSPWRKSSRRLIYNDELSHLSSPPIAAKARLAKDSVKEPFQDSANMDLSEFLIPQKANFKPRVRERENVDLSALLASSPNKAPLPTLIKSSRNSSTFKEEPSFRKVSKVRMGEDDHAEVERMPPRPLDPILHKMGFKPRLRDKGMERSPVSSSPVKSQCGSPGIFGMNPEKSVIIDPSTPDAASSSSGLKILGLSSPSRTSSVPVPTRQIPAMQSSPSLSSYDSNSSSLLSNAEKENQVTDDRTPKWTETVRLASTQMQAHASPAKPCLRSPLKTPSAGSGSGNSGSPTKNVAFVSSSPIPSSPAEPLSSTTWSRDHWVLLDSILQNWKPENQKGGQERRRRNSTRVISRLLGKNVSSGGEKMKLQQWHLEVVDEFRGIACGWQEAEIAMRVFALLVGEEKRALMREESREGIKDEVFET